MALYQSLYFMSLVGGMAGLFSWALASLLSGILRSPSSMPDLIPAVLLGGFMGGLTIGFSDYWSGNRVLPRWIISGAGLGCLAGFCGVGVEIPIRSYLEQYPFTVRVLTWMLVGSFIGLGLGLRWAGVNRARVGHAFSGGLIGGFLGGMLFATLARSYPDVTNAISFVLTGVGISCGITLAPILLREAVLQFVSSGDARAQSKFGRTRKQWELQEGDFYVIGSQSPSMSQTRYRPEIEVFVPDAAIAARHATLFAKEGRFYIARHEQNRVAASVARYPLKVRGKTISSAQELQHSDDIVIGRTLFRFLTRSKVAG